jgi:hypothetical protein
MINLSVMMQRSSHVITSSQASSDDLQTHRKTPHTCRLVCCPSEKQTSAPIKSDEKTLRRVSFQIQLKAKSKKRD